MQVEKIEYRASGKAVGNISKRAAQDQSIANRRKQGRGPPGHRRDKDGDRHEQANQQVTPGCAILCQQAERDTVIPSWTKIR